MNSTTDTKNVKNGTLFSTLASLKASILTFYRRACSIPGNNMADNVLVEEYRWIIFENYFCNFYEFEGRGHNSLTVYSEEIGASLIQYFQTFNPLRHDLEQNIAKKCTRDVSNNENRTNRCYVMLLIIGLQYLHEELQ